MCGKTLRVPELDGSVKPLPTPELNLDDSSLVDALGELAGIGAQTQSDLPTQPAADKILAAPAQSAPEPVTVDPLVPAKPVPVGGTEVAPSPRRSPHDTAESVAGGDGTVNDPHAELRTIAASQSVVRKPTKRRSPRRAQTGRAADRRSWIERGIIAGGFLLVGFGLALLFSPSIGPETAGDASRGGEGQAAIQEQGEEAHVADSAAAVEGRVTYVNESGDTRPDEGAKIIALPTDRAGTVKLDVAGFLVGSDADDVSVAAASLRALGGDVASADADGRYALRLDRSGTYHLLVVSRRQSRSWEVGVEENVQQQLARFFIRPSTLLGQLAYDMSEFQYRGQGTSSRDVAFERE